jgi:pseudouridine-5'-phosphate glycosidase/pseudouridine kinase
MGLISRAIRRPLLRQKLSPGASPARRRLLSNNAFFRVSEEVREALHSKKPVVALETTIYTHGNCSPKDI